MSGHMSSRGLATGGAAAATRLSLCSAFVTTQPGRLAPTASRSMHRLAPSRVCAPVQLVSGASHGAVRVGGGGLSLVLLRSPSSLPPRLPSRWSSSARTPVSAALEPHVVAILQAAAHEQQHEQHMHLHTSAAQHEQQSKAAAAAAGGAPPSDPVGSSGGSGGGASTGGTGKHDGVGSHPPSDSHGSDHSYTHQAREISAALMNLHLSSRVRLGHIVLTLAAVTGVSGLLIYIFRDPLKANLSEQTADVAKRSLNSTEVQTQVNVLSADVVQGLLNNPAVMAQCQAFLARFMAAPDTRDNLIALLQATANDPQTLALLAKFSSALLADLTARPETLQQLTDLLRSAIINPGNEEALQVLFKSFAAEPNTQRMVADLAKVAALDVLNDDAVKEAAKQFLKDVTADTAVQKSTGDALWNAVKFSLKPNWLGRSGHAHTTPAEMIAEAEARADMGEQASTTPEGVVLPASTTNAIPITPQGAVVVAPVIQVVHPQPPEAPELTTQTPPEPASEPEPAQASEPMPAPMPEAEALSVPATIESPPPTPATATLPPAGADVTTAEMAAQSAEQAVDQPSAASTSDSSLSDSNPPPADAPPPASDSSAPAA